ncbi:hypothetical protein F383_26002 [Gossypium arboreum]|uniref:Uncharacterized protein n=1 Tax=Gossypium arboreum TaxID=29729 RepID=A0A0B0PA38_GOSAR|nr:hypothetical protein F383_26002 [Gossypium arboreum]
MPKTKPKVKNHKRNKTEPSPKQP